MHQNLVYFNDECIPIDWKGLPGRSIHFIKRIFLLFGPRKSNLSLIIIKLSIFTHMSYPEMSF